MGIKYEWKSVEFVTTTAESLKKVAEQLTQVALEMQQHGLSQALFPWTQHQSTCLDVMVTLGTLCQVVLPAQILAKAQGRPSHYEMILKKSRRDIAARKARAAESGTKPEPARPRGRPKKKSG